MVKNFSSQLSRSCRFKWKRASFFAVSSSEITYFIFKTYRRSSYTIRQTIDSFVSKIVINFKIKIIGKIHFTVISMSFGVLPAFPKPTFSALAYFFRKERPSQDNCGSSRHDQFIRDNFFFFLQQIYWAYVWAKLKKRPQYFYFISL